MVVVSPFPVTDPRVTHVAEPERRGVIYAVNRAYERARADYVTVYVDWDNNGTLDDPGEVFVVATGGGTETGAGPHTFNTTNITVPPSAAPGTHRMRVWLAYNTAPTPCRTGTTSRWPC